MSFFYGKMKKLKEFLDRKFGIDLSIIYSITAKVIQATGALITIGLISLFLSKQEQGYYYTFSSIMAIQIFFELGLTSIIVQYVAHEAVDIQWLSPVKLSGSPERLSRLASILSLCYRVFTISAILLFIILLISGYLFFSYYKGGASEVQWQLPWVIVCLATALMLIINPILAYFEGLGQVKEVAKIRLKQQILLLLVSSLTLAFKLGLYALGFSTLFSFILGAGIIIFSHRRLLLLNITQEASIWRISYRKEIFPYHYKIALSWIGGFLLFQLFNPILFATEGAIVAGQMGITLAALNGISSISMSWITTKVALFSSFIARKEYSSLDIIFNRTVKQLAFVNIILLGLFVIGLEILAIIYSPLRDRFLPTLPVILLSITVFVNQFVFSWATYLRCHKQEPFLLISVLNGILCACSSIYLSHHFGVLGMVIGYTVLTIIISGMGGYYVFITKRREWHMV